MPKPDFEQVHVRSRSAWRTWLAKHHAQTESVWVVTFKKSAGKDYVAYEDLVKEALCFGWIDSRNKRLDDQRTMLLCSPRRAGSPWSASNKRRIARLKKQGLLQPPGLVVVDAARRDGSWTLLDDVEKRIVPPDLQQAFDQHPPAATNFAAFTPSSQKAALWWIKSAKQVTTRAARIQKTAQAAARNERVP